MTPQATTGAPQSDFRDGFGNSDDDHHPLSNTPRGASWDRSAREPRSAAFAMTRRHIAAPGQPTHDLITNEEYPRGVGGPNRYANSPWIPDGYADFAAGGAKHVPPPPLGHHARTARAAEAARLHGDRSAGASREEIAPKDCRWMKHSSMTLQQPELAASGELLGCANRSEASLRFVPPPEGFEARAPTVRRHPCDSSVHIEHGLKVDYLTEMDAQFRDKTQPPVRPLPPPLESVHLGSDGPEGGPTTAATEHFRDVHAAGREMNARDGAGLPRTRVPSHHLITGARAALPRNPNDHYGVERVFPNPEGTGHPLAAFGKNKVVGVEAAPYDVINGGERAWDHPYERPGARRSGAGLGGFADDERRARESAGVERAGIRTGTGPMATRPW